MKIHSLGRLPEWVPYRYRVRWDVLRVANALKRLNETPAIQSTAPEAADAEVHMLICKRDVWPAMLALKSLLITSQLRLALSLTDEGTLTDSDRELFLNHFPNCRWLSRSEKSVKAHLEEAELTNLQELYESEFSLSAKLLHPILLNTHQRVLVLDPDTAFFDHPQQLCHWVKRSSTSLYTRDNNDNRDQDLPKEIRSAFAAIGLESGAKSWRVQHYYFNSGFLAFEVAQCDLRIAESFLQWRANHGSEVQCPNADIWFGDWTREQACYMAMFAAMDPPSQSFGPEYRLGAPGGVFTHFMRAQMVKSSTLRKLDNLCRQLEREYQPRLPGQTA